MRAIMIMFDSLNRHFLPPYGCDTVIAPNFQRLAERTVTFDNCYAGSLPCMPARRELHTGRYNFLHRSWGPLEPFDDSMPEQLRQAGIHTHLTSDHPHYWEDGGATYHTRYATWEFHRGQEGDPWKAVVDEPTGPGNPRGGMRRQDKINRRSMPTEADHCQTRTFDGGLEFLETNVEADHWFLQIETFDPHEPFFSHQAYKDLYPHSYDGPEFDWPEYRRVTEPEDQVRHARLEYSALLSMCDRSLGRVLDFMDAHQMWDDTMLIVNTDHGFLLGEHGWWAKVVQPWFQELVHLPLFCWDPRRREAGTRSDALVQTIDLAPTLIDFFGLEPPDDVQGLDLAAVLDGETRREAALFGVHGGHVNVTDGRYAYLRGPRTADNAPLEQYTLMPTHMRGRWSVEELADAELAPAFGFTKGLQTLRTARSTLLNPYAFGTLLFDLENDPGQLHPLVDDELELRMAQLLVEALRASDAPASQYERLGLPAEGPVTAEHLLAEQQAGRAADAIVPLPPLDDFSAGTYGLHTPIVELLAVPAAAAVIAEHLPQLHQTELITAVAGTSIHELAASVPIPYRTLAAVADDLAALAPPPLKDDHDQSPNGRAGTHRT